MGEQAGPFSACHVTWHVTILYVKLPILGIIAQVYRIVDVDHEIIRFRQDDLNLTFKLLTSTNVLANTDANIKLQNDINICYFILIKLGQATPVK